MIVPFESAVKRFHSKDHAVTALTSPRHAGKTITRSALHHYQGRNSTVERRTYRGLVASLKVGAAASAIGFYSNATDQDAAIIFFVVGIALVAASRSIETVVVRRAYGTGIRAARVILAGDPPSIDELELLLVQKPWAGIDVVGEAVHGQKRPSFRIRPEPIIADFTSILELIDITNPDAVIFAQRSFRNSAEFRRILRDLEGKALRVLLAPSLVGLAESRLRLVDLHDLQFLAIRNSRGNKYPKRAFDIVGAAILLLLAAPVMGLVALAIKLEDGGPVMFRQTRVGLRGEVFQCLKFRSMVLDAEARLAELAAAHADSGAMFTMTHDPRITRVGRFIRRFSLDELPQLWNALRGDMSLVGPRPALPSEVAQYDSDTRRRLDVRPGLTGLWQVSGRSNLSWDDTVRLDLYYADNWSLMQDLMILAKTARAVIGSSGAY